MYPFKVRTIFFAIAGVIALWASPLLSISQTACSSSTIAPAACSGGNGAATSGVNINTGNTYWFSGGPTTFASLNLSGGTLRICGNLTITSMTINSGTLIIEQGGILNISGSFNVGNLTIINRGSLTITGSLVLQGTASTIYNDLTTSYLTITGSLTVNNASAIINRGIFTITGSLTLQGTGNVVCLQNNSIFNVSTLTNNVSNSITYAGNGTTACFSVSGSASLNNALTASPNVTICNSSGTPATGWGSATVITHCTSCGVVLLLPAPDTTAANPGANTGMGPSFTVYPNPVRNNSVVSIALIDDGGMAYLSLADAAGRIIRTMNSQLIHGKNLLHWDLKSIHAGIYFIRIVRPGNRYLYSAITILNE